ncbi:MAG: DNA-formamidopyrimidine glycosylase family protein, partial [Acidobacteriota bacterium]
MPELPDVTVYIECLERRIVGQPLERARVASPFLVRTFDPPLFAIEGKGVVGLRRMGKRIVWQLDDDLFMVFHLMIAGRFRWRAHGAKVPGKIGLAAFDFPDGTLLMTEASSKKRASLHIVRGEEALADHDPGGLEVLDASPEQFAERLRSRNHTLKRSLTSPRLFSGIGNAFSDEILHAARLSPLTWTSRLSEEEVERLYAATVETLRHWTEALRAEVGDGFPDKVTAFKPGMAVHGRYKEPCPRCGAPVQRIVYAANETNYCAPCQTGGKVLADRALSPLMKNDWP